MDVRALAVLAAAALLAIPSAAEPAAPFPQLLVAGDVASCRSRGDEATARLLDGLRGTILVLGDSVYERGTDDEYRRCYAPSWGRHRARTRPAVGNHEYGTAGAAGYFRYFGAAAAPPHGWYSFDLAGWHVVVLNSNCGPAGGCEAGSPQERWLRADLAAHPTRCTVAAMHHPRFSSGLHGSDETLAYLWRALAEGGADVVLAGHDHHYERFAQRDGIRMFVVGTGGRSHYPVVRRLPGSQASDWRTFGVLALRLRPAGYSWRFVPERGKTFRDAGTAECT
jgi:3',5'-cyclic AMP phosphodiesterase CpdA